MLIWLQAVPYHYESRDRQGVVSRVSEQRPAGQMDRLWDRETNRQIEDKQPEIGTFYGFKTCIDWNTVE